MANKLTTWFETHSFGPTENTLFYRDLDDAPRRSVSEKLTNPPGNELIVCSFFDANNFLLVGDKYVLWHSDTDKGLIPLPEIDILHRKGDPLDFRYTGHNMRYYHEGRVIERAEAMAITESKGVVHFLRHKSPHVFIRDIKKNHFDFKKEPGVHVDTIAAGIYKGRRFLEEDGKQKSVVKLAPTVYLTYKVERLQPNPSKEV